METRELKGNGKIVVAKTEIFAPHLKEVLAYGLPMVGPNTHKNVMAEIDKEGKRPTTRQTILFADIALQNQDQQYCKDIIYKFKNNYFWTATEGLSFEDGVFVYDNIDGKMPSTSRDLALLAIKRDPGVRFVDKGLKQGLMPIAEFLKHPYVIAQAGGDMIDTLGRAAKKCHQTEAYVYYLDSADRDTKRYTALYSSRSVDGLCLVGYCNGYLSGGGYASRVSKASTEGAKPAQKN